MGRIIPLSRLNQHSPAGRQAYDFNPGSFQQDTGSVVVMRQRLSIEFSDDGFVFHIKEGQEVANSRALLDLMSLPVQYDCHCSGVSRSEDFAVPVLPDRVKSLADELICHCGYGAIVIDLELGSSLSSAAIDGSLVRIDLHPAAFDCPVKVVRSYSCVASWFGM